MADEEKNKGGRPPIEITPELCAKAESLAAQGGTRAEIADCLGMGESTMYEKMIEYPEFLEALRVGKSKGVMICKNKVMEKAKDGDVACLKMHLHNNSNYREKSQVETTGRDGGPIEKKYTIEFVHANTTDKDATPPEVGEIADDQG